jgi:hypothetical protein
VKIIDKYLNQLQEREWNEDNPWYNHIKLKDIAMLLGFKGSQAELDMLRHTIQPTLIQLMKNAGGDYRGRETTKNTPSVDFSGMDWVEKHLPADWEDRIRKYIKKIARKHKE